MLSNDRPTLQPESTLWRVIRDTRLNIATRPRFKRHRKAPATKMQKARPRRVRRNRASNSKRSILGFTCVYTRIDPTYPLVKDLTNANASHQACGKPQTEAMPCCSCSRHRGSRCPDLACIAGERGPVTHCGTGHYHQTGLFVKSYPPAFHFAGQPRPHLRARPRGFSDA